MKLGILVITLALGTAHAHGIGLQKIHNKISQKLKEKKNSTQSVTSNQLQSPRVFEGQWEGECIDSDGQVYTDMLFIREANATHFILGDESFEFGGIKATNDVIPLSGAALSTVTMESYDVNQSGNGIKFRGRTGGRAVAAPLFWHGYVNGSLYVIDDTLISDSQAEVYVDADGQRTVFNYSGRCSYSRTSQP